MYTDPTGNAPIRELFGEINGTVDWHQSKSSKSLSYATVTLNGLSFNFVIDKNDNILLETADGLVVDDKNIPIIFGRFTFNYRNPNSNSKYMDIDTAKTLGTIGLYAVANDRDNPVTAFAVVHPEFLAPLSPLNAAEIEFRKDFYNALIETGFDANSYDEKMVKSVFNSMKAKNDYVKDDIGIRTMLKTQQNFAMNITSWDLYVSSLQYDLNRLSVLQGVIAGMAPNAMGNSFLYPKYSSYSMKVNGKEYFPKSGSETAFKGTGKTTPPVPIKANGGLNADDFSTSHSYNRHQYNPNTVSTKSKTQYGENVDVQELRRETLSNPDSVEYKVQTNPKTGDESHVIVYKKDFDGNISTPDTPTSSHRVFINLDDPEMSSHFPFYTKPK